MFYNRVFELLRCFILEFLKIRLLVFYNSFHAYHTCDISSSLNFCFIIEYHSKRILMKFHQKWKCLMHDKCIAYTYIYQTIQLKCFLYSKTDQRRVGGSYDRSSGFKKPKNILSLPEISFCANQNRRKRCWHESKCHHVNCLRNAQDFLTQTPLG